ncbi:MAG: hypothetical protein ABI193_03470 [Minicystis sp.]
MAKDLPHDLTSGADDPLIEGYIQRALAPYEGLLAPADLSAFGDALRVTLKTHPTLAPVVERVRRGSAVTTAPDSSHVVPKRPPVAIEEAATRLARRGSKGKRGRSR